MCSYYQQPFHFLLLNDLRCFWLSIILVVFDVTKINVYKNNLCFINFPRLEIIVSCSLRVKLKNLEEIKKILVQTEFSNPINRVVEITLKAQLTRRRSTWCYGKGEKLPINGFFRNYPYSLCGGYGYRIFKGYEILRRLNIQGA